MTHLRILRAWIIARIDEDIAAESDPREIAYLEGRRRLVADMDTRLGLLAVAGDYADRDGWREEWRL